MKSNSPQHDPKSPNTSIVSCSQGTRFVQTIPRILDQMLASFEQAFMLDIQPRMFFFKSQSRIKSKGPDFISVLSNPNNVR